MLKIKTTDARTPYRICIFQSPGYEAEYNAVMAYIRRVEKDTGAIINKSQAVLALVRIGLKTIGLSIEDH